MGTGEEDEEGDEEDREENVIISDGGSVSFYCIYLDTGYIYIYIYIYIYVCVCVYVLFDVL